MNEHSALPMRMKGVRGEGAKRVVPPDIITMPTWNEFLQGFGAKELILTILISLFIVAARQNFFRKGK